MNETPLFDREHMLIVRRRREWTQKELARLSGVSIQQIQALEEGRRLNPGIRIVKALAVTLGTPGHKLVPGLCECPEQSDAA